MVGCGFVCLYLEGFFVCFGLIFFACVYLVDWFLLFHFILFHFVLFLLLSKNLKLAKPTKVDALIPLGTQHGLAESQWVTQF